MYLKKVYREHKLLFVVIILFITGQLFINFKRGVVATPFFHYGMYSQVMPVQKTYPVWEVYADGQRLETSDYSIQQWDNIILPLNAYAGIPAGNELYRKDISRLMSAIGITADSVQFLQNCDYPRFIDWYKRYLHKVTGIRFQKLDVYYRDYRFAGGQLTATEHFQTLEELCR